MRFINFLITIGFILETKCFATVLKLTMHKNAEERGLVCNDGSPGGYYAQLNENSNKWLFFQQGGGWCYDERTCRNRITIPISLNMRIFKDAYMHPGLISSKNWKQEKNIKGLFDILAPDANLVYIPYCSSDAHMANTTQTIGNQNVFFYGRKLAFETVTSLVGSKENQIVLFGGNSAGGRGSMVTIDALRKLLPETTQLYGLHDSGDYVELDPFDSSHDKFTLQCERAYNTYNQPEINAQCIEKYSDEPWKCLCGQFMLPMVDTPSQVAIHLYDSYQLSTNIGCSPFVHSPKYWSEEACQYANYQFQPLMYNTAQEIANTGKHVVFATSCYAHGMVEGSEYYETKIDEMSAWEQFDYFYSSGGNDRFNRISECHQVNCLKTCKEIDFGTNSFC